MPACLCVMLQVLVYFAVAKLGEKPIDGQTDVNPEGLTAGMCWMCFCSYLFILRFYEVHSSVSAARALTA